LDNIHRFDNGHVSVRQLPCHDQMSWTVCYYLEYYVMLAKLHEVLLLALLIVQVFSFSTFLQHIFFSWDPIG
jgi:hypothetical protein